MKIKQLEIQARQAGFTLLELLVVITLIATLATAALVAYEGVETNAQASAQANSTASTDQAIRNYRGVTGRYPNQWDNLSLTTGGAVPVLATETREFFGELNLNDVQTNTVAVYDRIVEALDVVGIEELQQYATETAGVAPNLQHNEGANLNADEGEFEGAEAVDIDRIAIVPSIDPSLGTPACAVGAATESITTPYTGAAVITSNRLNVINDVLEGDQCHLVIAIGFGHDAAHSTFDSSVAIASAPTFTSATINPSNNYARYIALFHLGTDGSDGSTPDGIISAGEIRNSARLIGVVGPDGRAIDAALQTASATNQ